MSRKYRPNGIGDDQADADRTAPDDLRDDEPREPRARQRLRTEAKIGLAVIFVLLAVFAWVAISRVNRTNKAADAAPEEEPSQAEPPAEPARDSESGPTLPGASPTPFRVARAESGDTFDESASLGADPWRGTAESTAQGSASASRPSYMPRPVPAAPADRYAGYRGIEPADAGSAHRADQQAETSARVSETYDAPLQQNPLRAPGGDLSVPTDEPSSHTDPREYSYRDPTSAVDPGAYSYRAPSSAYASDSYSVGADDSAMVEVEHALPGSVDAEREDVARTSVSSGPPTLTSVDQRYGQNAAPAPGNDDRAHDPVAGARSQQAGEVGIPDSARRAWGTFATSPAAEASASDGNRELDEPGLPSVAVSAERENPSDATSAAGGEYVVKPSDSFWTISQTLYGSGAYFKALAEYNRSRVPDPNRLRVGDRLLAPDVADLEKAYPALCPKPEHRAAAQQRQSLVPAAQSPASGRTYVVQQGDNLFDIARYELGKASRWVEIVDLNRQVLGDQIDYLTPGMKLALPDQAGISTANQQPESTYR